MCPKTGGKFALSISLFIQYFFKQLLRKESALRKSVHPAPDFGVDIPIFGDFGGKVVLFDKIIGEVAGFYYLHIFIAGHWGVEVEIFDVDCHELGTWSGDYDIEKKLDSEEIDGGSAAVMWVVYLIAVDSETSAVGIIFFWPVVYEIRPYVTSLQRAAGMSDFLMKKIVLVPST